jgi:hypothetical protein
MFNGSATPPFGSHKKIPEIPEPKLAYGVCKIS